MPVSHKFLLLLLAIAVCSNAWSASIKDDQLEFQRLNDLCRDGSGDDPQTAKTCAVRDKLLTTIESKGWCLDKNEWITCTQYNERHSAPSPQPVRSFNSDRGIAGMEPIGREPVRKWIVDYFSDEVVSVAGSMRLDVGSPERHKIPGWLLEGTPEQMQNKITAVGVVNHCSKIAYDQMGEFYVDQYNSPSIANMALSRHLAAIDMAWHICEDNETRSYAKIMQRKSLTDIDDSMIVDACKQMPMVKDSYQQLEICVAQEKEIRKNRR